MANNLAMLKPGPFQPKGKRDNHQLLRSFQQYRGKMEIFLTALQLQHTGAVAGRAEVGHKVCPRCKQERAIVMLTGGEEMVRLFHEVGGVEDRDTYMQAMHKVEVGIKELNSEARVHKTVNDRWKWELQDWAGSQEDTVSEEDMVSTEETDSEDETDLEDETDSEEEAESMEETDSEDETGSAEPARVHRLVKKAKVGGHKDTEWEEDKSEDNTESNTQKLTRVVERVWAGAHDKVLSQGSVMEKAAMLPFSYETDDVLTELKLEVPKNKTVEISRASKWLGSRMSVMEEVTEVSPSEAADPVGKLPPSYETGDVLTVEEQEPKNTTVEISTASKRLGLRMSVMGEVAEVPPSDAADPLHTGLKCQVDNRNLVTEGSTASKRLGLLTSIIVEVAESPSSDAAEIMLTGEEPQVDKNLAMRVNSVYKMLGSWTSITEEVAKVLPSEAVDDVLKGEDPQSSLALEVSSACKMLGSSTSITEEVAKVLPSEAAENVFKDEDPQLNMAMEVSSAGNMQGSWTSVTEEVAKVPPSEAADDVLKGDDPQMNLAMRDNPACQMLRSRESVTKGEDPQVDKNLTREISPARKRPGWWTRSASCRKVTRPAPERNMWSASRRLRRRPVPRWPGTRPATRRRTESAKKWISPANRGTEPRSHTGSMRTRKVSRASKRPGWWTTRSASMRRRIVPGWQTGSAGKGTESRSPTGRTMTIPIPRWTGSRSPPGWSLASWCSQPGEADVSGVREQEKSSHLEYRVLSNKCSQQGYSVARKQVKFRQERSSHLKNIVLCDKGSQQGHRVARKQMKFRHKESGVQPSKLSHQGSWVKTRSRPEEGFRPASIRNGSRRSLARSNTEARPAPGLKNNCTEEHTACCWQDSGVKASCTDGYEFSLQEEAAEYSQQESVPETSRTEVEEFSSQVKDNSMRVDEYSHSEEDKFCQQDDVLKASCREVISHWEEENFCQQYDMFKTSQTGQLDKDKFRQPDEVFKTSYREVHNHWEDEKFCQQEDVFKTNRREMNIHLEENNFCQQDDWFKTISNSHSEEDQLCQQDDVFKTSFKKLDRFSTQSGMHDARLAEVEWSSQAEEVVQNSPREHMLPNHNQKLGGGDQNQQQISGETKKEQEGGEEAEDQDNIGGGDQVQREEEEMREKKRMELSAEEEAM